MGRRAHIIFRIGGDLFALPSLTVSEILPVAELATPPGLPPVMAGFLNIESAVVPVLLGDKLLGLDTESDDLYAHLLYFRETEPNIAIRVDRVVSVEPIDSTDVLPIASGQTFRDCIVAEISGFDHPVHLVSIERLLSEFELGRLASLHEAEVRRRAQFDFVPIPESDSA